MRLITPFRQWRIIMKRKYILEMGLCVIVLILTGCQNVIVLPKQTDKPSEQILGKETGESHISQFTPSPSPSLVPLPIITATSTPTIKPTATFVTNPLNSPTALPNTRLKTNCLEILPSLPSDDDRVGRLVLHGATSTYLFDVANGDVEFLPQNEEIHILEGAVVSPDGRWLAYSGAANYGATEYSYIVRSADGKQQIEFSAKDVDLAFISYWLDNEHLAMHRINPDGLDWVVIYNPFTKEQQVLKPDYPDIFENDYTYLMWPTGLTIYDPTLTRVVYVASKKPQLVLWDRQSSQAIVAIPDFMYAYRSPLWSLEGKRFAFVMSFQKNDDGRHDELFLVDWDGNIGQMTHLGDYYNEVRILDFSWSPNGRFIAFWMNDTLAVIDTTSQEVTDYCISTPRSDALAPVWSLDSQHLAIEMRVSENTSQTVLVDILEGYAAGIVENMTPVGWMVSP